MWEKYIAYVLGALAVMFMVLTYQAKTRANILKISLLAGICWVLYYFFENDLVSSVVCLISAVQLVIFILGIKHKWARHILWLFLSLSLTIVLGLMTFSTWYNILPIIAGSLVSISTYLKKESSIRALAFIGLSFWVANGIIGHFWFALLGDTMSLISIIIAYFRLDRKKKT